MSVPADLLEQIDALDPLPTTAQRLILLLGDEDISASEIAAVIELDQAIASNILRIRNSAFFAGQGKHHDLRSAVVLLGLPRLLEMILSDHLSKLETDMSSYALRENELWFHSATTALAAAEIVREKKNPVELRQAPIAALLHDIGKLVICRYCDFNLSEVYQECQSRNLTFLEAEESRLGFNHAQVGAAMGRRWGFPDPIISAIELHHERKLPEGNPILDVVVVANLVAKTLGVGLGAEGLNLRVDPQCNERLGFDFNSFCQICGQTAASLDGVKASAGGL